MPSFDVSSEMNWQEMDNAINQATKEVAQRFDFKGVKTEIKLDQKAKTITLWCSEEGKLDAANDILQNKLIKRGISLLSLEYKDKESAFGQSVRQVVVIQAGISKEKGKEIIAALKDSKTQGAGPDPGRASPRDRQEPRRSPVRDRASQERAGSAQSPDAVRKFQGVV